MSLRLFLDLVREIASSDVTIPHSVVSLIAVTVKQRKATAAFYSSDADAWRQNASHKKAIEVYEEVFFILDRAQKERSRSVSPAGCDLTLELGTQGVFDLATAMQQLAVAVEEENSSRETYDKGTFENEWIRDNPLLRPTSSKPKGKRKPKEYPLEAYEIVLEEEEEGATRSNKAKINGDNATWALSCFLCDVDRIRRYCSLVWSSVVPNGPTSRITAAYITNHAVHLTKQLEYDLLVDFSQFKDVHETQMMLFAELSGYIPVSVYSAYELQEQLMINTRNLLSEFGSILAENPVPIMKDGHFGYFDPSANRQTMLPGERLRENACMLLNYLPDLIMLDRNKASGILMGDHGLPKEFWTFLKEQRHGRCYFVANYFWRSYTHVDNISSWT
jgi:hypothetical protein